MSSIFKYEINKCFICFIHITSKTSLNLIDKKKLHLILFNLNLDNSWGNAYDIGVGKTKELNQEYFR